MNNNKYFDLKIIFEIFVTIIAIASLIIAISNYKKFKEIEELQNKLLLEKSKIDKLETLNKNLQNINTKKDNEINKYKKKYLLVKKKLSLKTKKYKKKSSSTKIPPKIKKTSEANKSTQIYADKPITKKRTLDEIIVDLVQIPEKD